MIYEFRTYTLKPRSLAEVEKRYGEAYEYRKKYSPLAAFWHTEVGPLNRIIHVWPYEDFAHRAKVRAQKIDGWPPNIREFVEEQESEIFIPAAFSPKLEPRQLGGIYEIRTYTLAAGTIPAIVDRWSTAIAERTKPAIDESAARDQTGRKIARGALYTALDRLETKGCLRSRVGEPLPERGGRARRFFTVTPAAVRSLKASRLSLMRLWNGLESIL